MAYAQAKTLDQKDIFKAIHRSQHCQRNWDLEQSIPEQDIDLILESVTQCPSKQNQSFYKVHVLSDRDIIEQVHAKTQGFGLSDGTVTTNAQTLANMVLVFESNMTQDHQCKHRHHHPTPLLLQIRMTPTVTSGASSCAT